MSAIVPMPRQFIHFHPRDGRNDFLCPRCRLDIDSPILLLTLQQVIGELDKMLKIVDFFVGCDVSRPRAIAGYAKDLVQKHFPTDSGDINGNGNGRLGRRG